MPQEDCVNSTSDLALSGVQSTVTLFPELPAEIVVSTGLPILGLQRSCEF